MAHSRHSRWSISVSPNQVLRPSSERGMLDEKPFGLGGERGEERGRRRERVAATVTAGVREDACCPSAAQRTVGERPRTMSQSRGQTQILKTFTR